MTNKTEATLISLKSFYAFLDSNNKDASPEALTLKAIGAMQYLADVEDLIPANDFKVKTFKELSRRIHVKSHMDETPMITTIKYEVGSMIEELTPKKPDVYYFTKRLLDSVWTCEYQVITKHQIRVLTWNRNNEIGYEQEKELPKGRIIEAEINDCPRTAVGAEIDGKIFEVINPQHVFNY